MRKLRLGIIAEDETDYLTLRELILRSFKFFLPTGIQVSITGKYGGGCGKVRRKAAAWARVMNAEGVNIFILVHDLDRWKETNALNDISKLEKTLKEIPFPKNCKSHICIPIEEIEAWFWSDLNTIKTVGRGKGKHSISPHNISKPKEKLIKLSYDEGKKPLYDTNDNPKLAKILDLTVCRNSCTAFDGLINFLIGL
jgi:Domain of unknown function (DUF4276)